VPSSRFEEVDDIPHVKAGQKRPRDDDVSGEDEDEDMEDEAKQGVLTKSQNKKLNKKLKAENGGAIPVGAPTNKKEQKGKGKERGKAPESSPEVSKKEDKEKKEHKKEEKEKKKEKKEKKKEQTNGAPAASTSAGESSNKKTLAGGLVIEDAKIGTGKTAKAGSVCSMRYIGKLTNGTVFDSNTKGQVVSTQRIERDKKGVVLTLFLQFTFKLGSGQVIKGWDQCVSRHHLVPSDWSTDFDSGVLSVCKRAVSESLPYHPHWRTATKRRVISLLIQPCSSVRVGLVPVYPPPAHKLVFGVS
jgi:FK506-binding nuclear protein